MKWDEMSLYEQFSDRSISTSCRLETLRRRLLHHADPLTLFAACHAALDAADEYRLRIQEILDASCNPPKKGEDQ